MVRAADPIADRVPSGPISTNTVTPSAAIVFTASANRTASRACAGQYPASGTVTCSPVSAPTHGTAGARWVSPAAVSPSSGRTGSIRDEWKAWLTRRRRTRRPRSRHRSATASTAAASPETTTDEGPFTAASDTVPRSAAISSSLASTAAIAPPSGSPCISRALAATSAQASSRLSTPAAYAAAISPTE